MRAFLAGRDRDGRASRRLQQAREWVDGQSSTKMDYWEVRRECWFCCGLCVCGVIRSLFCCKERCLLVKPCSYTRGAAAMATLLGATGSTRCLVCTECCELCCALSCVLCCCMVQQHNCQYDTKTYIQQYPSAAATISYSCQRLRCVSFCSVPLYGIVFALLSSLLPVNS